MKDESGAFWGEIKALEDRLAVNPASYCFARLAEVYLTSGLLDDAYHTAKAGTARYPDYVSGLRVYALAAHKKGLIDECTGALEKVVKAAPEDSESLMMLSRILIAKGDNDSAAGLLRSVLDFKPDDAEARFELDALSSSSHSSQRSGLSPEELQTSDDSLDTEFGAFEDETLYDGNQGLREFEEEFEEVEVLELEEIAELVEEEQEEAVREPDMPIEQNQYAPPLVAEEPPRKDPLSTATMAELYVQQGLFDKALEIYRAIIAGCPENSAAVSRIAEIEAMAVPPPVFPEKEIQEVAPPAFAASPVQSPELEAFPPSEGTADGPVSVLEGWLENIRRIRSCR